MASGSPTRRLIAFETAHLQRLKFHGNWNYTVTGTPAGNTTRPEGQEKFISELLLPRHLLRLRPQGPRPPEVARRWFRELRVRRLVGLQKAFNSGMLDWCLPGSLCRSCWRETTARSPTNSPVPDQHFTAAPDRLPEV